MKFISKLLISTSLFIYSTQNIFPMDSTYSGEHNYVKKFAWQVPQGSSQCIYWTTYTSYKDPFNPLTCKRRESDGIEWFFCSKQLSNNPDEQEEVAKELYYVLEKHFLGEEF